MPGGSERIASTHKQDREYADMFKAWSTSKGNKYGYYHATTDAENEYSDTEGFKGMYPAADEREVLIRTTKLIADTMIIFTVISLGTRTLFSGRPHDIMGMHLVREGFFIGNGQPSVYLTYIYNILLRIIPILYLTIRTGSNIEIMVPLKITNKPLFKHSAFFAAIAFGVLYLSLDVEHSIFGTHRQWEDLLLIESQGKRISILILYGTIIPIMSEVIQRGIFLSLFRQYGDGFGMIISSLLAASVNCEGSFMFCFAYSLMLSYFVLSTGSVLTSLLMRLIISNSFFGITMFRLFYSETFPMLTITIIIMFIGIGLIATIRFISRYSSRISMPIYNMYLTDTDKVMTMLSSPAIIVWITVYGIGNLMLP